MEKEKNDGDLKAQNSSIKKAVKSENKKINENKRIKKEKDTANQAKINLKESTTVKQEKPTIKFVVTGATGFVGNNFINHLLKHEKNCEIKLIVLPNDENVKIFTDKRLKIAYGDIRDKSFLEKEIEQNSIVFHFAGIVDISGGNKEELYAVNVDGTKNIAEICLEKKVKKLIYTSSVHAVEELKNNQVMTEPKEFDPDKVVGDYAKSKTLATKIIFELIKKGLNATVVYPSGITGPNDYKISHLGQLIIDLANKKLKAMIKGAYNFIDVRDVAHGIFQAYKVGKVGEGYLLTGEIVTVRDIYDCIYNFLGYKKPPCVPLFLAKMVAPLMEKIALKQNKKPLFTKYSLYTITSNCNFSNKKAQENLAFFPMSYKRSLIDALNWFAENKPELLKSQALKIIENNKYLKMVKPLLHNQ